MNPKSMLVASSLMIALASPGIASAQTRTPRPTPDRVTSSTTPARDRSRPYVFTTKGRVVPPSLADIRAVCPPGTNNALYCIKPTIANVCANARVSVIFRKKRSTTTISSRLVRLRSDCSFRSRVKFSSRLRTRRGVLQVRVRFQGNAFLRPRSAPTRNVRAG